MRNRERGDAFVPIVSLIVILVVIFVASLFWIVPIWHVWQQGLAGEAELKRAEQNRKVAVQEAQAKKDASTLLADAEVERAKGVAKANEIIGQSLKDNEAYLRWLWIEGLQTNEIQVVYIPTEAGMPILEANRLLKKKE